MTQRRARIPVRRHDLPTTIPIRVEDRRPIEATLEPGATPKTSAAGEQLSVRIALRTAALHLNISFRMENSQPELAMTVLVLQPHHTVPDVTPGTFGRPSEIAA